MALLSGFLSAVLSVALVGRSCASPYHQRPAARISGWGTPSPAAFHTHTLFCRIEDLRTRRARGAVARLSSDRCPTPGRTTGKSESCEKDVTRRLFLGKFRSAAVEAVSTAAVGVGVVAAAAVKAEPSFAVAARSIEDVKRDIEADFLSRRYYVTGDLTPSLYRQDCLFTDPTTRVASVERYTAAVRLLFDPDNSQVDLLSLEIKDSNHLFAKWRLQGFLKFPWHPYVAPYTGTTLYTLDADGLISRHEETWSISALDAFRATLTPTAGPQAPGSS